MPPYRSPPAEPRDLRDRLAEALLRWRYGLVRPLWADRIPVERLPWLHEVDVFLRMAAECGVSVTTTEAMFGLMTAIDVRAPERFEVTAHVQPVHTMHTPDSAQGTDAQQRTPGATP